MAEMTPEDLAAFGRAVRLRDRCRKAAVEVGARSGIPLTPVQANVAYDAMAHLILAAGPCDPAQLRGWQLRALYTADCLAAVLRDGRLPAHGRGSLPHGYVAGCGDECNNAQCPAGHPHDRCPVACLLPAAVDTPEASRPR